jgi:hypothetical protein
VSDQDKRSKIEDKKQYIKTTKPGLFKELYPTTVFGF